MDETNLFIWGDENKGNCHLIIGDNKLLGAIGISDNNTIILKINEMVSNWDEKEELNENTPILSRNTVYMEFSNKKGLDAFKSWLKTIEEKFDVLEKENNNLKNENSF